MRKSFVKITLTLCTVLLMAAPTQAFAASKPDVNSNCSANTVRSCTLNQQQVQSMFKSNQCKSNLSEQYSKYQPVAQSVKGIQSVNPALVTDSKGNTNCKTLSQKNLAGKTCANTGVNNVTMKLNCNAANPNQVANNNCNNANKNCNTNANNSCKANNNCTTANNSGATANKNCNATANNSCNATPTTTAPTTNPTTTAPTTTAPTTTAPTTAAPTTADSASIGAYEQQVATLVNKERAANGLPALKVNTKLSGVAEKKAEDMRDKNYFSHTSPTYGSPFDMMKQFGITYTAAGENIAKGQQTPESVMTGWMNSEGHRANILNSNYTEIGIGYVTGSNGDTYWVQMFVRP